MFKMIRILVYITALFLSSCGNNGIEGYVNEPITISATNPEDGQDVDYYWTLFNQPDGSLLNSSDLIASDDGQEMVFTPDYPGNYLIEVVISQYGDEISEQTFSFSILELSEKSSLRDDAEDESWLNEEIDDELEIDEDKQVAENEQVNNENDKKINNKIDLDSVTDSEKQSLKVNLQDNQSNFLSDDNEKAISAMQKMAASKNEKKYLSKSFGKKEIPKKGESIIAKTDRFTIQITSKKMLKDAQLFSQKLIDKGYDSYIQKVVFNKKEIWFRVRVGSYDNYNAAKSAADALSDDLDMTTWVDFVRKDI